MSRDGGQSGSSPSPGGGNRHLASLRWLNRALDLVIEAITGALLFGIMAINAAEILTRFLLNDSLTWVYEINQLMANWLYFLGICLVYHRGKDITVDFFFDRLRPTRRRWALLAIHIAVVAVLAVVAWNGALLLELQSRSSTMGLGIPNHWFSMPVFIGSLVIILSVSADAWALWRDPREIGTGRP